jgi:hypothetical protein
MKRFYLGSIHDRINQGEDLVETDGVIGEVGLKVNGLSQSL